jgi:hypothetical protein
MNERRQLIAEALRARFRELCERRIASLKAEEFGEHSSFVSRVQQQFTNAEPGMFRNPQLQWSSNTWQQSELFGPAAWQALALGELVFTGEVEIPPVDQFFQQLKAARKNEEQSLELLRSRYSCPINFTCAGEHDVREFVLQGLMVRDRRQIEESSLASAENDYLWYRLNLIAVHAAASDDLRFLDALNYYFELIAHGRKVRSENNWLFVSFLALYARALTRDQVL